MVPLTQDPEIQLFFTSIDQGDGTSLLKVHITNPNGIQVDNTRQYALMTGSSIFRSLGFIIVWDNALGNIDDDNWQSSIQLISGKYIDIEGVVMAELSPSMEKVN